MSEPQAIFQEPQEPEVFQPNNARGSGFKSIDDFISDRVALMSDDDDLLRNLNIAQANVSMLDNTQLLSYVEGTATKAFNDVKVDVLDHYANIGAIDEGVKRLAQIDDAAGEETNVRKLAGASAEFLSRFQPYTPAREVARRQYAALLLQTKLEEAGFDPETLGWKNKEFWTQMIPGRRTHQELTTGDFSLKYSVEQLHRLSDEEFLAALPDAMDEVMKMSGDNPFMFMERMQAYLDPNDIGYLKTLFAMDVVDLATTLGVTKVMKLTKFTRAANTPVKILRDAGQTKRAAELNAAALSDGAVARAARTTQIDAAQSTSPFGGEGLDPDVTDALAADTQAIIAARQVETANIMKPLHDPAFLMQRSYWTPEEVAAANTKYLNQFAGRARVKEQLADGFVAEVDIEFVTKDLPSRKEIEGYIDLIDQNIAQGTGNNVDLLLQRAKLNKQLEQIISYDAKFAEHQLNPTRTVRVKYRNNDFGELEAIEYEKANRFLNSPSTTIDQQMSDYTKQAYKVDNDTARVIDVLMRARSTALRGLKKSQKRDLDSILLEGDRNQLVYSDMDLVKGVKTPDGLIKLTTAEQIGAYRSVRDIFESLYELKNVELRQQLELGNFKSVFPKVNGEKVTNFVNPNKIITSEDLKKIKRIYNFDTDSVQNVDSINIKNVLDWKVYELKYPLEVGDEIINYIVAKEKNLKKLPGHVLQRRVGYVPKIDKDVFWIVEGVGPKMINGVVEAAYHTTVRYFDNPADANKWIATTKLPDFHRFELRSGREWLDLVPGRREEFEATIFGGLYGGKRSNARIPFGLQGTEAERLGGIEAMEAYMNHIATRMPAVNFRAGLIQRFLNSAKDPDGKSYLSDPSNWRSEIRSTIPHEELSGLRAMQQWVADQCRIPTTEERVWGNMQQKVAEAVSRVPGAGRTLSRWAMDIAARDVTAQIRGLSFHATLGWFNPSQLFVQAMGASLATSIDPFGAPLRIPKVLALRAAMFASSDEVIRKIGKAATLNGDDFLRMVRAYQKTGLHESTLNTGDWNALQGMPHGWETLRYVANKGLIFFREGERFSRNYAWVQAYDEITKGGKLLGELTPALVDQITDRHLQYTLNLSRANRAFWQKGILSIPTQFWQISTKFIENMLPQMILKNPHGWTGQEKAMIAMGQLAIFGAAGIPFGRAMYDSLANWAQSEDDYGLAIKDEKTLAMIQGGFSEFLMYNWTGERLDLTNRLSIPAGIEQMVEMLTSDNRSVAQNILGVSSQIADRSWEAIRLNSSILYAVASDPEADFDADVAIDVLDNVAQIASSWRNYQKAKLWSRLGYIPDRNGGRIIPIDDTEDRALLFAQALGISPKDVSDYYKTKLIHKNTEDDYRDAAIGVMQISQRYMNDPDMLVNTSKQARMRTEIQLLLLGFKDAEREIILKQVNERMKKKNYLLPEVMEKAMDDMYNKEGTSDYQGQGVLLQGNE